MNKNEKNILIRQINNSSRFANSYIIKISKEIYSLFIKSISAKGNKIKKTELFSLEENKEKKRKNKFS